jgi:hypothetical protein
LGRDHTIYALVPGFVKFWWHGVKRKNYVEVVLAPTPPGQGKGSGFAQPVVPADCKYPITRVRPWELPSLLLLPAETRITDAVRDQLLAYVRGLNPFQRSSVVPRGRPLIGGIHELLKNPQQQTHPAAEAAAAAVALAPSSVAAVAGTLQ